MSIVLVFFGCLLLYAKSKHFPDHYSNIALKLKGQENRLRIGAYLLFLLANVALIYQYGWATGLTVFLIVLMFGLSITIMLLPLHKKYAYLLLGLSLLSIIAENGL